MLYDIFGCSEWINVAEAYDGILSKDITVTSGKAKAIEDFLTSIRDYELTEAMKHDVAFNLSLEQAKNFCDHLNTQPNVIVYDDPIEPHIISYAIYKLLDLPSTDGIMVRPNGPGYMVCINEEVKATVLKAIEMSSELSDIFQSEEPNYKKTSDEYYSEFEIDHQIATKISSHNTNQWNSSMKDRIKGGFEKFMNAPFSYVTVSENKSSKSNDRHNKSGPEVTYKIKVSENSKIMLTNKLKAQKLLGLHHHSINKQLKKSDNGGLFKNEEEIATKLENQLMLIVENKSMSPLALFGANLDDFIPKVVTAVKKGNNHELQRLCSELEKGRGFSEKSPTGQKMITAIHQAQEDKIAATLKVAAEILSSNKNTKENNVSKVEERVDEDRSGSVSYSNSIF